MDSNDQLSRRFLLLPGDLCKFTLKVESPVFVHITFEDIPAEDRVFEKELVFKR